MIALDAFTGIIPRSDPTKLPDNAAQVAVDCDFTSGRLSGIPASTTQTGYAGGASGFVYTDSDNSKKLYTLGYDADFVRGPVQEDAHKRFYWTGKNGSTPEFKFARVSDNASGGTPSTNYKVGVAQFTPGAIQFNNAVDAAGVTADASKLSTCLGGFIEFARYPSNKYAISNPGGATAITNVPAKAKLYLCDANNAILKDITSIFTNFTTFAGDISYNGWYPRYKITLSSDPGNYSYATVGGATMTSQTGFATVAGTGVTYQAGTGWFTVDATATGSTQRTMKFIVLNSGAKFDTAGDTDTPTPVGTKVTVQTYADDGTTADTYVMYVRSETILSIGAADAIPAELTNSASAPPVAETHLMFRGVISYAGAEYTGDFHLGVTVDNVVPDSGIGGTFVKGSSATEYILNMRFGFDTGPEHAAWIFTFVNQFGEESAPFGPLETVVSSGYNFGVFYINKARYTALTASIFSGRAPVHGVRFYKTSTGSASSESYYYVGTINTSGGAALTGEVYFDTQVDNATSWFAVNDKANTALGAPCSTTNFVYDVAELQKLQGLTTLYNGMLAAFKDNEVWYCEPYMPWAWKRSNVHTLPHKVVALLPQEQGVYILTESYPYYASGASPDQMVPTRIPSQFPCVGKRSAVVVNGAAIYISPDGPVFLSGANAKLDTMAFNREAWRTQWANYVSSGNTINLAAYGHRLLCYFTGSVGSTKGYVYDLDTQSWTTMTTAMSYAMTVPPGTFGVWSDSLAYYVGSGDFRTFGSNYATTAQWQWRSKEFVLPKPINFSVVQMFGTGSVQLKVYADGVLKHTVTVALSDTGTITRLPSGFVAARWSFELTAQASGVELRSLYVAVGVAELRNV